MIISDLTRLRQTLDTLSLCYLHEVVAQCVNVVQALGWFHLPARRGGAYDVCKRVNIEAVVRRRTDMYVECEQGVIYRLLLSCGACYIG